jgi:hypothetical protein
MRSIMRDLSRTGTSQVRRWGRGEVLPSFGRPLYDKRGSISFALQIRKVTCGEPCNGKEDTDISRCASRGRNRLGLNAAMYKVCPGH